MDAVVWPDIRVGPNVFAKHAGLFTTDPTFFTDVFTSSTPTYVNILFIGFVSVGLHHGKRKMESQTHKPKKI